MVEERAGDELRWRLWCKYMEVATATELAVTLVGLAAAGQLAEEEQAWILRFLIRNPLESFLPHSLDYRRRALKAVVLAVEGSQGAASDDLMHEYTACLLGGAHSSSGGESGAGPPAAAPLRPDWCHKLWAYGPAAGERPAQALAHAVALAEASLAASHAAGAPRVVGGAERGLLALHLSRNMAEGSTGCFEWEAGFALAEALLSHPHLVRGKACVELGCGAGVVGVALARAGAASAVLTDGSAEVLGNCARNLALNGVPLEGGGGGGEAGAGGGGPADAACRVCLRQLAWEGGAAGLDCDVVVGADLAYDPTALPALLALVRELLAGPAPGAGPRQRPELGEEGGRERGGRVAFIATLLRNEASMEVFHAVAAAEPVLSVTDRSSLLGRGEGAELRFAHHGRLDAARGRLLLHELRLQEG